MQVLMNRNLKHGESPRSGKTREYRAWRAAKVRCYCATNPKYPDYGGRGIKMCDRWLNAYENFLVDMGRCPKGLTLGRKNNDGDYTLENCEWQTQKQQANNRRSSAVVEFKGQRRTVQEWAESLGIKAGTLQYRLSHGWPPEQALTSDLFTESGQFQPGWSRR